MVNLKKLCVGALLATTDCGMGALTRAQRQEKLKMFRLEVFCWSAVPAIISL